MTESTEDFERDPDDTADIDDVDAVMDVGAADQDTAVAGYLLDFPYGHRIDEIEDHDALGIGAELAQEDPEVPEDPEDAGKPVGAWTDGVGRGGGLTGHREDLARLLNAEDFADRVRRRHGEA
ncbi:hypothetical protein [Nocardiopsis aegyptia]|uniref:Uncharacterized protein n=1 Tax=Nocardiopsis aegyptia TaxID=220378 RepID=A0A7Z0EV29_9ACTN|nr:hypothetical protein [Nocardiopsis aegyptia]NYJ37843.1 hypothetical protein [Nocardiopsis aegyptia]